MYRVSGFHISQVVQDFSHQQSCHCHLMVMLFYQSWGVARGTSHRSSATLEVSWLTAPSARGIREAWPATKHGWDLCLFRMDVVFGVVQTWAKKVWGIGGWVFLGSDFYFWLVWWMCSCFEQRLSDEHFLGSLWNRLQKENMNLEVDFNWKGAFFCVSHCSCTAQIPGKHPHPILEMEGKFVLWALLLATLQC